MRSGVPDLAAAAVRRYCEAKVPVRLQGEVRVEHRVRGHSITIYECRAPWDPNLTEWSRQPVAQLRFEPTHRLWRLYCADRNSRWHYYDEAEPTERLEELLNEIDEDPTGIFWG